MSVAGATPFEDVLAAAGAPVANGMAETEELLAEVAAGHGPQLGGPAGETLCAGGKRLRPLLVLVCGIEADPERRRQLVHAGAAVELVHMATLVHDDVLDDAKLRRGRETVYASHGRATALAAGDFLFSRAFALLERNRDSAQVQTLSSACVALAAGELVQREDKFSETVDVERYLLRCGLKTASLFAAACRLGALAAGLETAAVESLTRFGERTGLAFQLLDDVLDVTGPAERTGKERGGDLLEGTTTLPLILAAEREPELAALDLRSVRTRTRAEQICAAIVSAGGADETRARARELVQQASDAIDDVLDGRQATVLKLVADRIVSRYS